MALDKFYCHLLLLEVKLQCLHRANRLRSLILILNFISVQCFFPLSMGSSGHLHAQTDCMPEVDTGNMLATNSIMK